MEEGTHNLPSEVVPGGAGVVRLKTNPATSHFLPWPLGGGRHPEMWTHTLEHDLTVEKSFRPVYKQMPTMKVDTRLGEDG